MTGEQWADPGARSLAIHLGQDEPDRAAEGTLLCTPPSRVMRRGCCSVDGVGVRCLGTSDHGGTHD